MRVDYQEGRYVASCTFEERMIPKAAGFQWDPAVKRWVTNSTGVAISLGLDKLTPAAVKALKLDQPVPVPDGLSYLPFQEEGIDFARRHSRTLIADQPGLGKGHPLSTTILTPTGWVAIGDLKHGDKVIGWSGRPVSVTGIFDRGILPIYNVKLVDGTSIRCDGDHLWSVYTRAGDFVTMDTIELCARIEAGEGLAVPTLLSPARLTPKQFEVPPVIAATDLATMHGILRQVRPAYPEHINYRVRDYALGAPHQMTDFLFGVVSSIGKIRTRNGFKTIQIDIKRAPASHDFVATITSCVRALGGVIFVKGGDRRYVLHIYLPDDIAWNTFGYSSQKRKLNARWKAYNANIPPREIVSVEPVGRDFVRCIRVDDPDSLYVAENFIVTHNTIQALGLINALPEVKNALIIPPASLKKNWLRESQKWIMDKSLSVDICDGTKWPNSSVVIINYDILNRHREKLRERSWDLVVADEHHFAKNPDSGRTKELHGGVFKDKETRKKYRVEPIPAQRLLMLSGTPHANRTGDLWTTVRAADPYGIGKDYYEFHRTFCGGYNDSFGQFVPNGEPSERDLRLLNKLMKERFMIRRLKMDVLSQLPEKVRQIVPLPADGLKAKVAAEKKAMTDLLDIYEKMIGVRKEMSDQDLVTAVMRIKPETWEKYANMVGGDLESVQMPLTRLASARQDLAVAKLPMVIEYVQNLVEQGEKVGVFAYHRAVIEGLMKAFPNSAVIWGDTPMESKRFPERTRLAQQDRFQEDPNCRVFIGQYIAAGTGWTLTAGCHFVAAELTYVPHELLQAEDRFHRIGSEIHESVWAHHLVVEGSLDDQMVVKLVDKMQKIEWALD